MIKNKATSEQQINKEITYQECKNKKAVDYFITSSPYKAYYKCVFKIPYIINSISRSNLIDYKQKSLRNYMSRSEIINNNQKSLINLYIRSLIMLLKSLCTYNHIDNINDYTKIIDQMFNYVHSSETKELDKIVEVCTATCILGKNMPSVYIENLSKQYESIIIIVFSSIYIRHMAKMCHDIINSNLLIDKKNNDLSNKIVEFKEFWNWVIFILSQCQISLDFYITENENKEWGQRNIEFIEQEIQDKRILEKLATIYYAISNNIPDIRLNVENNINISSIKLHIKYLDRLYNSKQGMAISSDISIALYSKEIVNIDNIKQVKKFLLDRYYIY